ncbi:hypothetical protein VDF74_14340 [Xanthomonas campestris pv. raphani]|uniref:hypothetical protein n=1 Tax=Xanthomonas campestris TaxID=339 RepID=UPI002B2334A7|nr:hypothetical protein [Xanthomonas campestris]MEA9740126.1 hypothetical protein [Xanthomonas campestris pv. raphani]MEB2188174.1 hypothetical protein [Xanthomonas campestris pv. campestris]
MAKLSKLDADLLIARLTSAGNLQELTLKRTHQLHGRMTEQRQIGSAKDRKFSKNLFTIF